MDASRRHRGTAPAVFCFVLVALTTAARAACPLSSPTARAAAAQGLTAAFQDADFEVTQGAMWFFKYGDIDEDCRDCYYANPSSTYGCPLLVRFYFFLWGRGRGGGVQKFFSPPLLLLVVSLVACLPSAVFPRTFDRETRENKRRG